jgi:hypothetical protein
VNGRNTRRNILHNTVELVLMHGKKKDAGFGSRHD